MIRFVYLSSQIAYMAKVDLWKELKELVKPEQMDQYLSRFPSKVGSYGYDPWGFHVKGVKRTIGLTKFLYEKFFRVEAYGLENIPKEGRVLIIGNHSGQLPMDGLMVGYAMLTNPHGPRAPKAMVERWLPTLPIIGNWLSSLGAVIGDPINCERMLDAEEAIIVFPEGVRGSGKTFKHRYELQRFGNGFMHLATRHNAPIIPVGIVGCEESVISFADIKPLAKTLGLPYAPLVMPMLLPTKVFLHFGEPMYFEGENLSESETKAKVEHVKQRIRELINLGLAKRQHIFE
jgi:1-acyl-sn-glycerol-3-phosphate acyltransferase